MGTNFNEIGGGVYAMEWTSSNIKVWFFPRTDIPDAVTASNPDTSNFGMPVANIAGGCDIDTHFWDHAMVFDTTFCGDWAGSVFETDSCPMTSGQSSASSCVTYVAENPTAFDDAYWAVNSIKIYQAGSDVASSAVATASATSQSSTVPSSYASASATQESTSTPSSTWTTSTFATSTSSSSSAAAPTNTQQTTTAAPSTTSHPWGGPDPTWSPRSWKA